MRSNLPVTNVEYVLRDDEAPTSKTDIHGDIVSAGDLTGRGEANGLTELAGLMYSLRMLQVNLRWLVGQIKESMDLVNTGAHEMASGNADLSSRTESQAAPLEETASSMVELTNTVKQNTEQAHHVSKLVRSTADMAVSGGEVVGHVISTMGSIKESARKIADIIGVIDGIAFQTDIVALNVAAEAARAGEQGRGFAVVADIIAGTATARQELSTGIDQVNQAVSQMDEITQQNAAVVEQSAAASESLQEQAMKLPQLVGSFKLVRGGQLAMAAGHGVPREASAEKPRSGRSAGMRKAA